MKLGWLLLAPMISTSIAATTLSNSDRQEVQVGFQQNTAYEFVATVDAAQQRYRFITFIPRFDAPDGLEKQRNLSGWKKDFLFVRQQCGQPAEWRCTVDQVFTRQGGALIHVGSVESAKCKELGCSFQDGVFTDLFDVYQINPVTGATDAPPLPIARRLQDKELVSDLAATWALNQGTYKASIACLEKVAAAGFAEPCEQNLSAWTAFVFAAKLTRYTDKQREWDELFSRHAVAYCKRSADAKCDWRIAGTKEFMLRITPGAAPRFTPAPVTPVSQQRNDQPLVEKFETGKTIRLGK